MSDNPQLGDIAIHTYKYKGDTYREYVQWRRHPHNLGRFCWFNGQGEMVMDKGNIQPIPSAEVLHVRLDLPDPLAYTPKLGDVATYMAGSSVPISVQYRYGRSEQDRMVAGWFTAQGSQKYEVETDSTFRLILRDGQLQEGASS